MTNFYIYSHPPPGHGIYPIHGHALRSPPSHIRCHSRLIMTLNNVAVPLRRLALWRKTDPFEERSESPGDSATILLYSGSARHLIIWNGNSRW